MQYAINGPIHETNSGDPSEQQGGTVAWELKWIYI